MADEPEMWASILGWHCWRGVAGIWHARRMGASPAAVLHAASLDALRALIDRANPADTPGVLYGDHPGHSGAVRGTCGASARSRGGL